MTTIPKNLKIVDPDTLAVVAKIQEEDGDSTLAGTARRLIFQAVKAREASNKAASNQPATTPATP